MELTPFTQDFCTVTKACISVRFLPHYLKFFLIWITGLGLERVQFLGNMNKIDWGVYFLLYVKGLSSNHSYPSFLQHSPSVTLHISFKGSSIPLTKKTPMNHTPPCSKTHFWFPALWHSISGPGLLGSKADLVGLTGWRVRLFHVGFCIWCAQNNSEGRSSTLVTSLIESYGMILPTNKSALWVRKGLGHI